MVCPCVLGSLIPAVVARDPFAPAWMKEGVYVKYITDRENSAFIFNITDPQNKGLNYLNAATLDRISYLNASLIWECVSVNSTTAKLKVTLDYVGKELFHFDGTEVNRIPLNNEALQLTGEAYVDLYTRAVYTTDGTLLGTTHLWLPANPIEGQDMVVWDVPPEKSTLQAILNNVWFETNQGKQDGFQLGSGTVTTNGETRTIMMSYDLDTGLGIDGYFQWDPIMASIGIGNSGLGKFSDTNISLGSEDTSLNWTLIIQYAILPIAIVLLSITLLYRRIRKKTPKPTKLKSSLFIQFPLIQNLSSKLTT